MGIIKGFCVGFFITDKGIIDSDSHIAIKSLLLMKIWTYVNYIGEGNIAPTKYLNDRSMKLRWILMCGYDSIKIPLLGKRTYDVIR